jgi:predicted small metal-binding protein
MRVFDCNECGHTVVATDDDALAARLTSHMSSDHADVEWDEDEVPELIAAQAYDATDS